MENKQIEERKPRKWTIGDLHGNYKALLQVLERAPIKPGDTIIQLGDVADGWHEVYECVEHLLKMKEDYNMIFLKGNHDQWFLEWIERGTHPDMWIQGGEGTLRSYTKKLGFGYGGSAAFGFKSGISSFDLPKEHIEFWKNQLPYYKDEDNNFFVHGGFNRHYTIAENLKTKHVFWWDRDLFSSAMSAHSGGQKLKIKEEFKNIFIGHTQTTYWKQDTPFFVDKVINIDTGAGWSGKLTIIDVDTHEFWQSDDANSLYPGETGRK